MFLEVVRTLFSYKLTLIGISNYILKAFRLIFSYFLCPFPIFLKFRWTRVIKPLTVSPIKVPEKRGDKLWSLTFHLYALDKNDKLYVFSLHQIVWDSHEEILRLQLKLKGFKINWKGLSRGLNHMMISTSHHKCLKRFF